MTALFTGLFDDAALFPPGDAPMAAAVPAHRQLRARLGDLVGLGLLWTPERIPA